MSQVLGALLHPAELGCIAIGGFAVTAVLLGFRKPWLPWGAVLAILALGLQAALFREGRAVEGVRALPWNEWAGEVALYHAWAARIGWVAAVSAATVLAVAVGSGDTPRGQVPAPGVLLGVALACAGAGWFAPEVAGVLIPGFLVAVASGRAITSRTRAEIGVAATLVGVAAIAGAETNLYGVAALVDPADVHQLDAAGAARIVAAIAAVVLTAWGAWRAGLGPGLLPIAGVLALVGFEGGAAWQALSYGPASLSSVEIDAGTLPEWLPSRAARIPGGCLVRPEADGWVGGDLGRPRTIDDDVLARRGLPACPPLVAPGAFGAQGVPLLAVPGDTPTERLRGWHGAPVGELAVLVRLGDGWSLRDWRISAVRFAVWEAPAITRAGELAPLDPHGIPLPGAVLVAGEAELAQQLARIRAATSRHPRAQVLIHPSAAPTVSALLALCRGAEQAHGPGLACVLATGDPARWSRVLGSRATGGVDPDAAIEVIEVDD